MEELFNSGQTKAKMGRRRFLKDAVAVTGGAVLLSSSLLEDGLAAGTTDALLLTCIDYRFVDNTAAYMAKRHLTNKYDIAVLAGAALGAVTDKYPEWNKTFWDHLGLAIKLHQIKTVLLMDHRDCGAYKLILGEDCCNTPAKETEAHATQLKNLRSQIGQKYPDLANKVELLLMDLSGKVEIIR